MNVVEIEVGFDPFHAQVIVDHCADEGVTGELVLFDETRYELGMAGRVPNQFLVRVVDEPVVRRIIADLYPDLAFGDGPPAYSAKRSPSPAMKAVGLVLLVLFAGPFFFGVSQILREIF